MITTSTIILLISLALNLAAWRMMRKAESIARAAENKEHDAAMQIALSYPAKRRFVEITTEEINP